MNRRLLPLVFIGITFVSTLASSLLVSVAHAAAPPAKQTIAYNNISSIHLTTSVGATNGNGQAITYTVDSDFVDEDIWDNNHTYKFGSGSCAATIVIPSFGSPTGHVQLATKDPYNSGKCVVYDYDVKTIDKTEAGATLFNWSSDHEITTVVGGIVLGRGTGGHFTTRTSQDLLGVGSNAHCDLDATMASDQKHADLDVSCVANLAGPINPKKSATYKNVVVGASPTSPVIGTGAGSGSKPPSCESHGVMAWLFCPVIKMLDSAINWLDTQIQALLEVDQSSYDNPDLYAAWSQIRNFAYIILIPIMLVMVITTAMGSELFSAYTVKKALPRMAAAVLFITLSYFICTTLINLANVVGGGIAGIMSTPFNHLVTDHGISKSISQTNLTDLFGTSDISSVFFALPKIGAAIIGIIIILFFFWPAILLFVGTAFIILILRQLFVVALLLIAPLAILAWIFPGNDKLWKGWWSSFSKLLIMFPLIMVLIAIGRDMAWLVNNDRGGSLQGTFIAPVAKLALYILPYAFIPATFKFAGGVFATVSGMAQDKGKGLSGMLKKGRAKKLERTSQGNLFKGKSTGVRGLINRRAGDVMHAGEAGLNPLRMQGNLAAARSKRISAQSAKAAEDASVQAVVKNDDLLQASLHGDMSANSAREYLRNLGQNGEELAQNVASIQQARKAVGADAFNDLAVAANAGTGTGFGAGPAEMLAAVNKVAGGDRARASRILAGARGNAERARRVDLYGAGFAASNDAAQAMFNAGAQDPSNAAWQQTNRVLARAALRTKSAGEIASGRHNGFLNLMPAIEERLDESTNEVGAAHAAEDEARGNGTWTQAHAQRVQVAESEHKRILAHSMSMHDIAGQVSEENSQVIGERILSRDTLADGIIQRQAGVDMTGAPIYERTRGKVRVSVQHAVDGTSAPVAQTSDGGQMVTVETQSIRGDEDFTRYRREYAQPTSAAQAQAIAAGIVPPGVGLPPPGSIPGAPTPGAH